MATSTSSKAKTSPRSSLLFNIVSASSLISIGFGINAIVNPSSALSFFELSLPILPADRRLVETLVTIYAIRSIFMGISQMIASYYGNRKILGGLTIAIAGVILADGIVCWSLVGKGWWNHWPSVVPLVGLGVGLIVLE